MKTLYLVRHAKAISRELGTNDFKRMLSKQGCEDAEAMSKRLGKKGISPELLIASPADRALETAHIFAERFGYPVQQIVLKDEIYDEEAMEPLLLMLQALEDRYHSVMVFGHEPALSQLAGFLLKDTEDVEMRTSGVLGLGLRIGHWRELAEDCGSLLLFDFPVRATPKVYKQARKTIAKHLTSTMQDILEQIDESASKHLEAILKKTSKKMAKELTKVLRASKIEDIAGTRPQKRVDHLASLPIEDETDDKMAQEQMVTPTETSLQAEEHVGRQAPSEVLEQEAQKEQTETSEAPTVKKETPAAKKRQRRRNASSSSTTESEQA